MSKLAIFGGNKTRKKPMPKRNAFGSNEKTIEVNIFDFSGDLYDKNIRIEFLKFIRDEIKFDNAEELQNQLINDRENCIKNINSTYNN